MFIQPLIPDWTPHVDHTFKGNVWIEKILKMRVVTKNRYRSFNLVQWWWTRRLICFVPTRTLLVKCAFWSSLGTCCFVQYKSWLCKRRNGLTWAVCWYVYHVCVALEACQEDELCNVHRFGILKRGWEKLHVRGKCCRPICERQLLVWKRQELRKTEYVPGKPQATIFVRRQLV